MPQVASECEEDDGSEDDDPRKLESHVSHRVPHLSMIQLQLQRQRPRQRQREMPQQRRCGVCALVFLFLAYSVAHVLWQVCGHLWLIISNTKHIIWAAISLPSLFHLSLFSDVSLFYVGCLTNLFLHESTSHATYTKQKQHETFGTDKWHNQQWHCEPWYMR